VSRLTVVTAVELEARGLARELGLARVVSSPGLHFASDAIEVIPVGLGATLLGARWPATRPDLVVSAGTCGALGPAGAGSVMVPRSVLTTDGARLDVDAVAHARAVRAAAVAGHAPSTEPLVTAGWIVETPGAKAALRRKTGAMAVDMESAVIIAMATRRGVPAVVVRAVSDTAEESVPSELAGLVDDAGRTRGLRAAALALRRPALIPNALALQRATAGALRSVAAVLAQLSREYR
jgi:adenosylhomocysteine nucleosidase